MSYVQPPFTKKKLIHPEQLKAWADDMKKKRCTIATLNGSFDLLHAGHLHILYEASKQADLLIVALNSDASIKRYKSADRPIIPLRYRLEMMSAIEFVDFTTWFEEDDPRAMLEIIRPHVHVNGSEYGENCIEAEVVKRYGGRVHIVEKVEGLSTSQIIARINDATLLAGKDVT